MAKYYKPKSKQEAVLWNNLNNASTSRFDWDWVPIRDWPIGLQTATVRRKLGRVDRWKLWLFFVGNGMDPIKARKNILMLISHRSMPDIIRIRKELGELVKAYDTPAVMNRTYRDMQLQQFVRIRDTAPKNIRTNTFDKYSSFFSNSL